MTNSIHNHLIHFSQQCIQSISQKNKDNIIDEGLSELSFRLEKAADKPFEAVDFPVLNHFDDILDSPYLFNFRDIAKDLKWRPSPRADFNAEVMALCSFNEMLKLGDVVAGLMFMSPHQMYPEHRHPPQEVYFVLSGKAQWLYGGNEVYQHKLPGDVVYNHPQDLHGMLTGDEPLLALYFLWGNKTKGYSF